MDRVLVTGGAGFIGCNFVKFLVSRGYKATVLDKMTYAGSSKNLDDVKARIKFIRGDITSRAAAAKALKGADTIVNFAAETHVDRSIRNAGPFVRANVFGVYNLLEAARKMDVKKFMQISTDEVYGSLEKGKFRESDTLNPRNPYSATKAAAENLVVSYANTYGIRAIVTRSSNNYGPYQFPEKFIPKIITNAIAGKKIPVYGRGQNVRDWIYVGDNCLGIFTAMTKGKAGEIYNIGGGSEKKNIDVVRLILKMLGKPESLIEFVEDRPGHDFRYALDSGKITRLGWNPGHSLEQGLRKTITWYAENEQWWRGGQ